MRRSVRSIAGGVLAVWILAATAASAQPEGNEWDDIASPWHDGVHWIGIAGGALAVLALVLGLIIYVGPRLPGKKLAPALRKKLRSAHLACGLSGAGLALAHHVGRLVQAHEFRLALNPPALAGCGFVLLLISGVLRAWPPRGLRRSWRWLAFVHRLAFVAALFFLVQHTLVQFHKFSR